MDGLLWKTLLKCMIWGESQPYFRKHPYRSVWHVMRFMEFDQLLHRLLAEIFEDVR